MATNHGASNVSSAYQCPKCGWYRGAHDENCPEETPLGSPERKRWDEGYEIGYRDDAGTQCPTDPVARLGYGRGQYALEYRQNVCWSDYYEID
jgi:hypothetical protein